MSVDNRIREGLALIESQLPGVDPIDGYDDLTRTIRRDDRRRSTVLMAGAAAAVLAAAVAVSALTGRDDRTPEPAPAPDRSLAPIAVATGLGIHLVHPGGATGPWLGAGGFPAFSPDGSRVVYVAPGLIDTPADVMITDADGTDQRLLVDCRSRNLSCGAPSWAPDGLRVAVPVLGGPRDQLRIVTVSTGESVLFRMPRGEAFDFPAWSEDGTVLLGVHVREDGARVATMDPTVGPTTIRDLSGPFERIDKPDWSPDGRLVAFSGGAGDQPWSDADHPSSLYVIGADGSSQHQVASLPAEDGRIFGVDWTTNERPFLVTVLSTTEPHYIATVGEDGSLEPVPGKDGPLRGWHAVQQP